jgi:hypothetical protein
MRGGFRTVNNGGFVFSCFNCGFKANWAPGRILSKNAKQFLEFLGASPDEIKKINFECLKTKSDAPIVRTIYDIPNKTVDLPPGAKLLSEWAENPPEDFLKVLEYMNARNPELLSWHDFYWTPDKKNHMNKRIIIPYTSDRGEIFGYAARSIEKTVQPKYMCQVVNNAYIFNMDALYLPYRKYAIVCEGVLDAVSLNCCACMKQYLTDRQIEVLSTTNKKIVIVPDRDNSGKELVLQALKLGYSVSMPDWSEGIKDIADAVTRHGRLATMQLILNSIETYDVKIKLKMKRWFDGR